MQGNSCTVALNITRIFTGCPACGDMVASTSKRRKMSMRCTTVIPYMMHKSLTLCIYTEPMTPVSCRHPYIFLKISVHRLRIAGVHPRRPLLLDNPWDSHSENERGCPTRPPFSITLGTLVPGTIDRVHVSYCIPLSPGVPPNIHL